MADFLIVKTSSLGDIIQAFSVLDFLHSKFPDASIDWAVEERFKSLVAAHPLVRRTLAFDIKGWRCHWRKAAYWRLQWAALKDLRRCRYDAVFDLQGNCKSGAITMLSRGVDKAGFGKKSVREWPNLLATRTRFDVFPGMNIRLQYLELLQKYFNDSSTFEMTSVRFTIGESEKKQMRELLSKPVLQAPFKVMVCPGSKWVNKQLPVDTLADLLGKIGKALSCSFLLMWGEIEEKEMCQAIQRRFPSSSLVVDRMDLPLWQNLMSEMDLVIAVDSAALHLAGTTSTPSFSIFGPTSPDIFKPAGQRHFAWQGACPFHRTFEKQCPLLRSCPTGGCIRNLSAQDLFDHFWAWLQQISSK